MDPMTTTTDQYQLAYLDLGFALIDLFFNIVVNGVFQPFATSFFSGIISFIQMIFTPAA